MQFPSEKLNRFNWTEKTPSPSVETRYKSNTAWKKYLARELSKIPGGLDGLVKTEAGYTNQLQLKEVA